MVLSTPSSVASADVCSTLVKELDGLWDKLGDVHPSLTSLQLIIEDSYHRKLDIDIRLPNGYPNIPPICLMELPEDYNLIWKDGYTLNNVISQYTKVADKYNSLWIQLEDIDNNCWVLEPDKPSLSIIKRRIALENHCSISIELVCIDNIIIIFYFINIIIQQKEY